MRKEHWKDIPGYEECYQASTFGRIRSKDRRISLYNGGAYLRKGRIISPTPTQDGYLRLKLCKNGKERAFNIHKLVALTWIPNPNNLPEVNHKNERKTDNSVKNLEWCSHKYNVNYGTFRERVSIANGKPVTQYDLSGKKIRTFHSSYEAQRVAGIIEQSINLCCQGKRQQAGGYRWKYADDDSVFSEYTPRKKPVLQKSEGMIINEYKSIAEAQKATGINNISACCRGKIKKAGGFEWEYKK